MRLLNIRVSVKCLKVSDCNPIHYLSNSANVSSRSANALFCVCALKKKSGVCAQPWLCNCETNKVAETESRSTSEEALKGGMDFNQSVLIPGSSNTDAW